QTSFDSIQGQAMKTLRRTLLLASVSAALVATAAVAFQVPFASAQASDKKQLVIGATAGPYADQVKLGIKPILEKKGYKVKVVEFNDYVQPNYALAEGSLDANAFQHSVYLE